jgi:hypothetical protein
MFTRMSGNPFDKLVWSNEIIYLQIDLEEDPLIHYDVLFNSYIMKNRFEIKLISSNRNYPKLG